MTEFLEARRNDKLDKLPPDDPKRRALQAPFDPAIWLEDAARRVAQIQVVTHSLKPIHPEAKGSSLYRPPLTLAPLPWVGTHCLGDRFEPDVVGNAAALDVYKFLKLSHEGRSFLALAVAGDADFVAALSDDEAMGRQWAAAFAGLAAGRTQLSSHALAKQLYWRVGGNGLCAHDDSAYHLLAPLYPTSLVHRVHEQLQADRFSDEAKAARAARREGAYHARPVRDYTDLAIQKLGGTKPQNISQLNSERRGENFLLASVPPVWKTAAVRPLLRVDSLFKVWGRRSSVTQRIEGLRRCLESAPTGPASAHQRASAWVEALVDELVQFQGEVLTLEPGWSQSGTCRLPPVQRRWLDPDGQPPASPDEDCETGPAPDTPSFTIAGEFARWLQAQLRQLLPAGTEQSDEACAAWRALAHAQLQALAREAA